MSSRVRYEVFHHPVEIPNEPKVFLELRGFFDGEYVVEDLFFYWFWSAEFVMSPVYLTYYFIIDALFGSNLVQGFEC